MRKSARLFFCLLSKQDAERMALIDPQSLDDGSELTAISTALGDVCEPASQRLKIICDAKPSVLSSSQLWFPLSDCISGEFYNSHYDQSPKKGIEYHSWIHKQANGDVACSVCIASYAANHPVHQGEGKGI